MAEERNKGPLIPISGIAILLAAIGITFSTLTPLKGSRPPVPEFRESYGKVDARLWQDPFSAVLDHLKFVSMGKLSNGGEPFKSYSTVKKQASFCEYSSATEYGSLACELKRRIQKGKVTVLGVMVFGSRYEEDAELRIRRRYAVLSGLSRVGFVPEDPEHLGFISVSPKNCPYENKVCLSNIMPFEWLRSPGKVDDSILLLWMNDQVFKDKPLVTLGRLVDYFDIGEMMGARVVLKIIGPTGSTTLKSMIAEIAEISNCQHYGASPISNLQRGVEIYSPFATVDESILLQNPSLDDAGHHHIEDLFNKLGISFTRTIGSDKELADKLIEELSLRRVTPMKDNHHILLVAEWDTDYGRSLPEIFTTVLKEKAVSKNNDVKKRVHVISYMRGIDGSLPGEKEDNKEEKTDTKSKAENEIKKLEMSSGKSQFDYLRRLTEETYKLDHDLRVNNNGSIKAIGVLGSDFYDKYLVIQALRQRFPEAVYFTTDLDARFFHPESFKWTRNLLVASNFDLALRAELQGGVPPFRDNYQTSAYYATLRAFAGYLDRDGKDFLSNKQRTSQVYEIGRHGAVNLDNPENTINPGHETKKRQRHFIGYSFIIVSLLSILLFLTSEKIRGYAEAAWSCFYSSEFKRLVVTTVVVMAVTAAGYFLYQCHLRYDEEPFLFFEGISSWPSELIRMIAAIFAIYFICKASKDIEKNRIMITNEYFGKDRTHIDNPECIQNVIEVIFARFNNNKGVTRFVEMVREYCMRVKFYWEDSDTEDIEKLWREYLLRDSCKYRIMRTLPIFIVYIILCLCIIGFSGFPVKPIRGNISNDCDKFILISSVLSFIILVFYVFDVTFICRQFISNASDKKPIWSYESKQAFFSESGIVTDATIQKETESSWSELRLLQLIAKRTEAVGKLIFYPFIVLFILFVARINYFDNWHTPLGLAAVFSLSAAYAWSCALFLRRAAENARSYAIRRLNMDLQQVHFAKDPDEKQMMRIRFAIDEIKSIREGAFLPFLQHPAIQSLLLLLSVIGVNMLDILQK